MKGGSVYDFIDHTTMEECAVLYKGIKYFFHGLIHDSLTGLYSYEIDIWDKDGNYEKTVYNKTATTQEECLALAQKEPIFEGKTLWEAEADMEWVEW